MSEPRKSETSGAGAAASAGATVHEARTLHRVMLTGVRSEMETSDSFAIKFSILAKAPLPRVKQLMRSLPVALWTGTSKGKAEQILELVEEAGGKGSIVQTAAVAPRPAEDPKVASTKCACCGFPMKEGAERCEFCRTAVGESAVEKLHWTAAKKRKGVPRARLVVYLCIIAVEIVVLLAWR